MWDSQNAPARRIPVSGSHMVITLRQPRGVKSELTQQVGPKGTHPNHLVVRGAKSGLTHIIWQYMEPSQDSPIMRSNTGLSRGFDTIL